MLPRAGLRDQPRLPHLLRQQGLAQHVVDLVGPGVVQILPFQVDLRAAQLLRQPPGVIQPGGPSGVFVQQLRELCVEGRVLLVKVIRLFQFDHRVHQRLRDILPAVDAESSRRIRHFPAPFSLQPPGSSLRKARSRAAQDHPGSLSASTSPLILDREVFAQQHPPAGRQRRTQPFYYGPSARPFRSRS